MKATAQTPGHVCGTAEGQELRFDKQHPIRTRPRRQEISDFVNHLFEPSDIIELRLFRGERPNLEVEKEWTTLAGFDDGLITRLGTANRDRWNICIGPNPRRERGKSGDKNVLQARCLFVDFDKIGGDGLGMSDEAETIIDDAGLPQPTMIVNSGHGVHCYWRLSEAMTNLAAWTMRQKALIRALKSDRAIHNPERFMRLPIFLNMKAEPVECYIVSQYGVPYRATQ
jgi:hypothetical protein